MRNPLTCWSAAAVLVLATGACSTQTRTGQPGPEQTPTGSASAATVTAEDYSPTTLSRQREVLAVELRATGLQEVVPLLDKHLEQVAQYQRDKRVSRAQWLKDWSGM